MKRDEERLFSGGLGPELDFLRQLWALDHALQLRSTTMARRIGVTSPQRLVLRLVGRFPGVLAGSLARLLHLDPSTITGLVSRLEKEGLIGRQIDRVDRRRRRLIITAKGTELLSAPEETIESATTRTLGSISAEEAACARRVLALLESHLLKPSRRPRGRLRLPRTRPR